MSNYDYKQILGLSWVVIGKGGVICSLKSIIGTLRKSDTVGILQLDVKIPSAIILIQITITIWQNWHGCIVEIDQMEAFTISSISAITLTPTFR